ncbi:glycosyltransferase [Paenibacillus sp. 1001270B_150601_E10]|uniref:GAP1-N2 domain-containing protein n=1 Tax=Paenibacillus sp. 1001270B_150601_E10 TaxID=2787079 RepID=UPI00189E77B4|nr:glycosyltransferase [Paenibacillus sp. 1001270B_150601_E10]
MRPSSSAWIEQQMYTRERRGIFRSNEGYDTIAISKGLDPNFVKKVLHPFCVYDAPAELTAAGEKDGSQYPESIHLYHTEQGAFILGRSIYQVQDFTGLRSAFFTHHYVVPPERSEEAVTDYRRWLHAAYADHYDVEEGTGLPQLSEIPTRQVTQIEPVELLSALKMDERMYKQLLFAIMNAATGRKKVYVALDVPIQDISKSAALLLELVYQSLPYAYRRMLGYMTYSKEPESKKGIHIMFVEKGSLRSNDRNIEREFTFDLVTGKTTNLDIELENQPYLDFAWKHLTDPDGMDTFYRYADQLLAGTDLHKQIAILSYHELCIFYQLEQGEQHHYMEHKLPILRALLAHMSQGEMTPTKQRLHTLFLKLLDSELEEVKRGGQPEPELLDCFKDYWNLADAYERGKTQLVPLFIHSIHQAMVSGDQARADRYYHVLVSHQALSLAFFDTVLNRGLSETLFDPYVTKQFHDAPRAGDVIDFVCEWGSKHNQVLKLASFRTLAQDAVLQKLRKEAEPLKIANAILEQLHRLPRSRAEEIELAESELMDTLIYAVNCFLLFESDLHTIKKADLLQIGFLKQPKQFLQWVRRFEDDIQSKAEKMVALHEWLSTASPDVNIFDRLSQEELEDAQRIGQRLLSQELGEAQFPRMVLAFYRDTESRQVEYGALLQYLHQHANNKEMIYDFFRWSEQHHDFVRSKKPSPAYAAALVHYFKKYDRDAFKHRAYRKHYFEAGTALTPVYNKAKAELSSPLMRMLSRNKKALWSLGFIVVIVAGAIFTLQATGIMGGGTEAKPPAEEEINKPVNVKPEPELSATPVTAAVIRTPVDGAEKEVTALTFSFSSKSEADGFIPESIIVNPGPAQETLSILKREPSLNQADPKDTDANQTDGTEDKNDPSDQTEAPDTTGTQDVTSSEESQNDTNRTDTESPQDKENVETGPFIVRLLLTDKTELKAGTVIQAQNKKYTIKDQA